MMVLKDYWKIGVVVSLTMAVLKQTGHLPRVSWEVVWMPAVAIPLGFVVLVFVLWVMAALLHWLAKFFRSIGR